MQYHALSLSGIYDYVYVLSYGGEDRVVSELRESDNVFYRRIPYPKNIYIRILLQTLVTVSYLFILQVIADCRCLISQVPPSIPNLLSIGIIRLIRFIISPNLKIIIDYHNLGYTLSTGFFAKVIFWNDVMFRWTGDINITVSKALSKYLSQSHGLLNVAVVYDKPLKYVNINTVDITTFRAIYSNSNKSTGKTLYCVSSTSWTDDEDFGFLAQCLARLSPKLANADITLKLVVTGKPNENTGRFLSKCEGLSNVYVKSLFVDYSDYFSLLCAADFAISMHGSSSGLDLPMKIIDFLSCGLPVLSCKYITLNEQIRPGIDSEVFENTEDFEIGFFKLANDNIQYRSNLKKSTTWNVEWDKVILPSLRYGTF